MVLPIKQDTLIVVNLILSKYVITNQIDVCEVMYETLPINSDWYSTVFSDLLLMLQKLFSWENVPLQTQ